MNLTQDERNSHSEETMTRYELATLSVAMGSAAKAAEAIAAYPSDTDAGGRLLGCWASDIGALNTIAVLRGFNDDAELLRRPATIRTKATISRTKPPSSPTSINRLNWRSV